MKCVNTFAASIVFALFASCTTLSNQRDDETISKGTPLRNYVADLKKQLENGSPRDYEMAEYFLVAETLMQKKQFDTAELFYKAVFDAEPSLVVGLKLARIDAIQNQPVEAENILKKLSLFYPKSAEPALEMAMESQMVGDRAKTLAILEKAYGDHPDSEEIASRFTEYLVESGQKERAKRILTESLKRAPTSQYFLLKLAQLKTEDKNFAEAKMLLNTMLQNYPENVEAWTLAGFIASEENNTLAAEKYFREAFDRQPENDALARFYVLQLLKQSKFEEARRVLLKLEASSETDAPLDAELSFQLAYVLFQLEDYAEAKKRFISLVDKSNEPGRLYFYAGQCDELSKNSEGAKQSYLKVTEKSSFYKSGLQRLAFIASEKENFAETATLLKQINLTKEDGEPAFRFVASLYVKMKDYKNAVKVVHAGLKLFPHSEDLEYLTAAYLEYTKSRVASLQALDGFVRKHPNFTPALNHLGYMLADQGQRLDFAANLLKRAVKKDPDNGFYRDSLGWAYFRLKKYEDAERELLSALKDEKEEPIVMEHLGELNYSKKKYAEALKYFEMAESSFQSKPAWKIEADSEWKDSFERVKKRVKELREMALPPPKDS